MEAMDLVLRPQPQSSGRRDHVMHRLSPITPGELLQEEFLEPLGNSQYRLAMARRQSRPIPSCGVPSAGAQRWLLAARPGRPRHRRGLTLTCQLKNLLRQDT
jgi:hypothetical protein